MEDFPLGCGIKFVQDQMASTIEVISFVPDWWVCTLSALRLKYTLNQARWLKATCIM